MVVFDLSEGALRLAISFAVFLSMALWEASAPWRLSELGRGVRWTANLGLMLVDTALLRLVFPLAAVGAALWAEQHHYGLFNTLRMPRWIGGVWAFFMLDFVIYWQHRIFHRIPMLWRLHRVHHSDTELDLTSGVRFHPVEILLSMLIKIAAVVALGAPALTVIVFEAMLNATSLFNHSNVRLSPGLERLLRFAVVTPDMHRIHHSVVRAETDSNFGFNFPWWDKFFGSYRAEPIAGRERLTIGLNEFRDPAEQRLDRLLMQPLKER